jgi:hypothetical protein
MDGWIVFAFIEGLIIILLLSFDIHVMIVVMREARKRRTETRKKLNKLPNLKIQAEVTQVSISGRIRYEVRAEWHSFETGKTYIFHETYWFLRGMLGMRPNIYEGDFINVDVAFRPFIYLIDRRW